MAQIKIFSDLNAMVWKIEVAPGDPAARAGEGVEVVAEAAGEVPDAVEVDDPLRGILRHRPAEERVGVAGVVLRVAAAREVADDAPAAVGTRERADDARAPRLVYFKIGAPVAVADRPLDSVVLWTATVVEHFDQLQKVVVDGHRR